MVLPGHLAAGYLVTKLFISAFEPTLTGSETITLYIVGILAGILPDIDIAYHIIQYLNKSHRIKNSHREYITHTPIFWLIISVVLTAVGYLINLDLIKYLGCVILLGTWSHLVLDSLESGVMWLWPVSHYRFALKHSLNNQNPKNAGSIKYYLDLLGHLYDNRQTFYAEILITLIALFVFFY